jgi:hypothetical protein
MHRNKNLLWASLFGLVVGFAIWFDGGSVPVILVFGFGTGVVMYVVAKLT